MDLVQLNKFVERPTHPFPAPKDIVVRKPKGAKRLLADSFGGRVTQIYDVYDRVGTLPLQMCTDGAGVVS